MRLLGDLMFIFVASELYGIFLWTISGNQSLKTAFLALEPRSPAFFGLVALDLYLCSLLLLLFIGMDKLCGTALL